MSIGSLVTRFGIPLWIFRPTVTLGADGEMALAFASVLETRGFVQPSTQTSDVAQGRENARTNTTIYLEGSVDVRIDDEIRNAATGTTRVWRVVGATNAGEVAASAAAPHLNATVVECVEVKPETSA